MHNVVVAIVVNVATIFYVATTMNLVAKGCQKNVIKSWVKFGIYGI
jgi:hypothetical protein